MEIETESQQRNEPILNVGDENMEESERSEQFMIGSSEDEGDDMLLQDDATEDFYHFDVSVAVSELESDEIDAEFAEAIEEIEGERVFPCSQCEKVCKSRGGLTRHTRSKHPEDAEQGETRATLTKEAVASIVESIKVKLKEEKLYGKEIMDSLSAVSSADALFDALSPLYATFCRKNNQDKLLKCFYGLIPRSCELLRCGNYKVANLVMIHIPEHLIGFYNTSATNEEASSKASTPAQLHQAERGPLCYVAGYVISKLFQFNKKKQQGDQGLQSLLQAMKSNETNNYILARTRGGLVTPCSDLVGILEVAEILFREKVVGNIRHIPVQTVCDNTLKSPTVQSLWENIVFSCEVQPSKATQKLCLENIIKLYLRVRSFSYARDFISKYRIREKQSKKKGLRKEMKQGEIYKS